MENFKATEFWYGNHPQLRGFFHPLNSCKPIVCLIDLATKQTPTELISSMIQKQMVIAD
jgi:hypothetical protein